MTDEQQDAVIGRALREHKEARESLAKLKAEAARFGGALGRIAQYLRESPQTLVEEGEPAEAGMARTLWKRADVPSPDQLRALTGEIRQIALRVQELERQLKGMGYDVRPDR